MNTEGSPRLTLVILAAGMGSRYGGLKQLEPVGPAGETLMEYSVYDARRAGFERILLVIRRDIETDLRAYLEPRFASSLDVGYVWQQLDDLPPETPVNSARRKPWGTAHAVWACRELVDGPFAVINADDFYGRTSFERLAGHLRRLRPDDTRHCFVSFRLRHTLSAHGAVSRGLCEVDGAGLLRRIVEQHGIEKRHDRICCVNDATPRELSGEETVSMNMWGVSASLFAHLERGFRAFLSQSANDPNAEYLMPDVVTAMIANATGTFRALPTAEPWMGITYPKDKPEVVAGIRRLVDAGVYPPALWKR